MPSVLSVNKPLSNNEKIGRTGEQI